MFQSPGQIAFSIGSISIHYYGILIAFGIVLAFVYAVLELKRRGLNYEILYDLGFWMILGGILGARLYYVVFKWDFYAQNPIDIFAVWEGGLAIHGALLGGFLAFFIFTSLKKMSWLLYADVLAPGVILAQAIGRWGNFFNNEAFGKPTDLAWKLFIPEASRPEGYTQFSYFHPAFLYEFLWNLLGFFVLLILTRSLYKKRERRQEGLIFFSYLMFYSFGRFFIEGLRLDSLYLGNFRIAQITSILLFIIGLFGVIAVLTRKIAK